MPFATGAQTAIAQIPEVTWGTTPATPELTSFPVTNWNMRENRDIYESKDLRSDRQVAMIRHGFRSTALDFGFELKHGIFDWFLEAVLFGSFSSNVLKGGVTAKSFLVEGQNADITQFRRANGFMANTLSVKIGTEGIVTCTGSMIGKSMTLAGTTIDNAGGYTNPAAKTSMTGYNLTLLEGGGSIAVVSGLEFTINNGLDPAKVLGSTSAAQVFSGRQKVTGKLSAYFENSTLLNKFLNESASSLSVQLADPSSNTLTFLLPNIRYTGGGADVSGESGLQLDMPFQAIYDNTEATSIKVTRSA